VSFTRRSAARRARSGAAGGMFSGANVTPAERGAEGARCRNLG
jgi:hypothetical protein